MGLLTALLSGLLFGVGLMVSGMANPAKVLGFLDIAGRWDPSLAFVMLGAIAVASIAFRFAKRRKKNAAWVARADYCRYYRNAQTCAGKRDIWRGLGTCGVLPGTSASHAGCWLSQGVGLCRRDASRHGHLRAG